MYRSFTPKRVIPGIKHYEKVKLHPTPEQAQFLDDTLAFHKQLWQMARDYERTRYRETGEHTSYAGLSRWWTKQRYTDPRFLEHPTTVCEFTLRILSTEMAHYYRRIKQTDKYIAMRSASSLNFFTYRSGCHVEDDLVFIPKLGSGIRFDPVEFLGLLKNIRFIRTKTRWYVLFTMLVPPATYTITPLDKHYALPVNSSRIGGQRESRVNPRILEPPKHKMLS